MKFGIFYERAKAAPWAEAPRKAPCTRPSTGAKTADSSGIEKLRAGRSNTLSSEEYSHSSAPEVFLAACSQRTKNIRLGHGIMLMLPGYNHPARAAERIATLDLVSHGRVEWGTGMSASRSSSKASASSPKTAT